MYKVFKESEVQVLKELLLKLKIVSEECVPNWTYHKYKQAYRKGSPPVSLEVARRPVRPALVKKKQISLPYLCTV